VKLKVKTIVNLTPEQRGTLWYLGCDTIPFIAWPSALIFAATCTSDQEREMRDLAYVIEVEPMPTYGIAAQEG
jgi:hypothetical protein